MDDENVKAGGWAENGGSPLLRPKLMRNFLAMAANAIYIAIFYLIALQNVSAMISGSIIAGVLAVPAIFGLWRICRKGWEVKNVDLSALWKIIRVMSLASMVLLGVGLRVKLSWDWGQLIGSASGYVLTGEIDNVGYYARYPNNQFWLSCLITFFRIVKTLYPLAELRQFKAAAILLNCLMILLAITLIHCEAKILFGEIGGFLCGCMAALCLPMYLYATFPYTDTSGMLVGAAMMYVYALYVRCMRQSRAEQNVDLALCAVGIGMLASIALRLKVAVFIIAIAIAIDILLRFSSWRRKISTLGVMTAVGIMTFAALQIFVSSCIQIDDSLKDQYEYPPTHWIMMAAVGSGGYNSEDDFFTMGFPSYEEKKAATTEELKNRIKDKGLSGMAKHVFVTKLKRTWCNSCLAGDDYVGREPITEGTLQRIFTQKGDLHWICLIYSWLNYIVLILGCLLSGVLSCKRKIDDQPMFVGRVALIGVFIFFSVWECNSRYLVAFLPVLVMVAADGFLSLREKIKAGTKTETLV